MLVSGVVRRTLRHGRAQTQTGRSEAKESRLQRTSILPLRGMPATCCDACGTETREAAQSEEEWTGWRMPACPKSSPTIDDDAKGR